jgi:hypothetical protein
MSDITVGTRIRTLKGEQDCDENDNERHAAPGEIGVVFRIGPEGCHVTFEPSQVWVVLELAEIGDPEQYEVLSTHMTTSITIDVSLLRQQRDVLLKLVRDAAPDDQQHIDGLINMLDFIIDDAIEAGFLSETGDSP